MNNHHYNLHSTDLSPDQRVEMVHKLRLQIPVHQRAIKTLSKALERSQFSAEPRSLFIGGDSGMGKTTMLSMFAAKYPRVERDDVDQIPVLLASIPATATTKGTASTLLKALGDPKAYQGELAKLTDRLLTYLSVCEVKIIVLDEFQHIIDRESSRVRARTADWLKSIVNESGVPLALVGLPHSEVILEENVQLDRRFHRRIYLPRFSSRTAKERAEFRTLLKILDQHLPFPVSAGLDDPKTADWLFKRCKGLLGPLMALIRDAAEAAIEDDAPHVMPEHLEWAFEENKSRILRINAGFPAASKKRKGNGPSLGEVLRT